MDFLKDNKLILEELNFECSYISGKKEKRDYTLTSSIQIRPIP